MTFVQNYRRIRGFYFVLFMPIFGLIILGASVEQENWIGIAVGATIIAIALVLLVFKRKIFKISEPL